jgi:hypothetical protein
MVPVASEDGQVTLYNREIASVWHLAKDWQPGYGGQLIDHHSGKTYNPGDAHIDLPCRREACGTAVALLWHCVDARSD